MHPKGRSVEHEMAARMILEADSAGLRPSIVFSGREGLKDEGEAERRSVRKPCIVSG